MRREHYYIGLIVILSAGLFAACSNSSSVGVSANHKFSRYLVGAHYYLWFPKNFGQGFLREKLRPSQEPMLGLYSSRNIEVAEQHIAWASQYGIDFFTLDWWPTRNAQNEALFDGILQARNIDDVKFCIFYELWDLGYDSALGATVFDDDAKAQFLDDMRRIAARYYSNPSYLKVDGRPVIILYLTRTLIGQYAQALQIMRDEARALGYDPYVIADEVFWKVTVYGDTPMHTTEPQVDRISLFDAITAYNFYQSDMLQHGGYAAASTFVDDVSSLYEHYREAIMGQVPIIPSVISGYNDRGTRLVEDHFVIPRQWEEGAAEGSLLSELFDRLVFPHMDPRMPMVLITSWNEWNEDTAIEPLAPAPATTTDNSRFGNDYTQGYSYSGYGMTYLEVVRNKVISISGRVVDSAHRPLSGITVHAWKSGELVGKEVTDYYGFYTFSRLSMQEGEYLVGPDEVDRLALTVDPLRTVTNIDFVFSDNLSAE